MPRAEKIVKLDIEILASTSQVRYEVFERDLIPAGPEIEPKRARLQYLGFRRTRAKIRRPTSYGEAARGTFYAGPGPEIELINAALVFVQGVAAGVLANWLYGKLKRHSKGTELRINKRTVEIERRTILRVIEEQIQKER